MMESLIKFFIEKIHNKFRWKIDNKNKFLEANDVTILFNNFIYIYLCPCFIYKMH